MALIYPRPSNAGVHYYMNGNVVVTPIGSSGTYVKALGTTTANVATRLFTHTSNRATYTGLVGRWFHITADLSMHNGSNDRLGVAIAVNGVVEPSSIMHFIAGAGGRASGAATQSVVWLEPGYYFEVFISNEDHATDITVDDLQVVATVF